MDFGRYNDRLDQCFGACLRFCVWVRDHHRPDRNGSCDSNSESEWDGWSSNTAVHYSIARGVFHAGEYQPAIHRYRQVQRWKHCGSDQRCDMEFVIDGDGYCQLGRSCDLAGGWDHDDLGSVWQCVSIHEPGGHCAEHRFDRRHARRSDFGHWHQPAIRRHRYLQRRQQFGSEQWRDVDFFRYIGRER